MAINIPMTTLISVLKIQAHCAVIMENQAEILAKLKGTSLESEKTTNKEKLQKKVEEYTKDMPSA